MTNSQQLEQGQQWLETLLRLTGFATPVQTQPPDPDQVKLEQLQGCWLTIGEQGLSPEQVQVLLSSDGAVLDAIQYLMNASLNITQERQLQEPYIVELAGYRVERLARLSELVNQAISHVRQTGEPYEMPPLSAAERRLLHTAFQDHADLETFSRGEEPDRRLVVQPTAATSQS